MGGSMRARVREPRQLRGLRGRGASPGGEEGTLQAADPRAVSLKGTITAELLVPPSYLYRRASCCPERGARRWTSLVPSQLVPCARAADRQPVFVTRPLPCARAAGRQPVFVTRPLPCADDTEMFGVGARCTSRNIRNLSTRGAQLSTAFRTGPTSL
eukprot:363614-Chlamydomonas_euryale.AAC.8